MLILILSNYVPIQSGYNLNFDQWSTLRQYLYRKVPCYLITCWDLRNYVNKFKYWSTLQQYLWESSMLLHHVLRNYVNIFHVNSKKYICIWIYNKRFWTTGRKFMVNAIKTIFHLIFYSSKFQCHPNTRIKWNI